MDSSTIIFIATLFVAFIFLRWLISPIPQTTPVEFSQLDRHTNNDAQSNTSETGTRTHRRQVNDSMIEVVQAIAPQLTRSQIRMDLERSGSVELTVQRYMDDGTLPFPEGETEEEPRPVDTTEIKSKPVSGSSINLIERYDLQGKINGPLVGETGSSSDLDDKTGILNKRREEMILNARKRLASKLKNELDL